MSRAPEADEPAGPPARRAQRGPARRAAAPPARAPEAGEPGPAEARVAEASGPADLAEIKQRWDEVIAELQRSRKTSEAAFLRDAVPVALEEETLTLAFSHMFHHDQMAREGKRRDAVAAVIARLFSLRVKVRCRLTESGDEASPEAESASDSGGESKLEDVMSMFPGSELEE